jgi:hypothetical protein
LQACITMIPTSTAFNAIAILFIIKGFRLMNKMAR